MYANLYMYVRVCGPSSRSWFTCVCTVICAFLYTHILHMPTSLYVYTCTICKYIRKYLCVDRYVNYICGYICYRYIYIHIYNMDMYTYKPTYLQLLDQNVFYMYVIFLFRVYVLYTHAYRWITYILHIYYDIYMNYIYITHTTLSKHCAPNVMPSDQPQIYIYIYMNVYIYIHVHAYMHIYLYLYTSMYVYICNIYIYIYIPM